MTVISVMWMHLLQLIHLSLQETGSVHSSKTGTYYSLEEEACQFVGNVMALSRYETSYRGMTIARIFWTAHTWTSITFSCTKLANRPWQINLHAGVNLFLSSHKSNREYWRFTSTRPQPWHLRDQFKVLPDLLPKYKSQTHFEFNRWNSDPVWMLWKGEV